MKEPRGLAETTEARHTNVLPTPEYRRMYADTMVPALNAAARAAQTLADQLHFKPDTILGQAFQPTLIGMSPATIVELEISVGGSDEDPIVVLKGKCRVVRAEIGFRVVCQGGVIRPTRDNSFGG